MKLTDEQRGFALEEASRILLEAPAGTGKTQTVAARVKVAVSRGRHPIVLAFTNTAREAIQARLDSWRIRITVKTVDAYALELVRRHLSADIHGVSGKDIAQEECFHTPVKPDDVLTFASLIRCGAPLPAHFTETTAQVYERFEERKADMGVFTFTDILTAAVGLRDDTHDEIIVDEAQDLSPISRAFIEQLGIPRITFVGDSQQAIFGFTGVDPSMFEKLRKDGWKSLYLTHSFRVPSAILPIVNSVLPFEMTTARDGGSARTIQTTRETTRETLLPLLEPGDVVLALGSKRLQGIESWMPTDRPELRVSRSWEGSTKDDDDTVRFSTIHKAKGGQWKRVFVLDVGQNGIHTPFEETEEQRRRLFYVACSRALDDLYICQTDDELPWGIEL